MNLKDKLVEKLTIDSLSSRLNHEERNLWKWIMEYTIDNDNPFNRNSLEKDFGANSQSLFDDLLRKKVMVANEEGDVKFIFPISTENTDYKVTLNDGRNFSAMCAIDAMGSAFTFKQDIRINSCCKECKTPISMKVIDGKIVDARPEETHVSYNDLNKSEKWAAGL
jgi:hypothetical protein